VLRARTPRSIGPPTRVRSLAAGGLARRSRSSAPGAIGPLPSMGSPKALTTRPSRASDGRTVPAAEASEARAPSRTPSSEPKGRQSARSPRKPTTSTPTVEPPKPVTVSREPTLISCTGPATSTRRPCTAATRP
jgi:hypothetical protein